MRSVIALRGWLVSARCLIGRLLWLLLRRLLWLIIAAWCLLLLLLAVTSVLRRGIQEIEIIDDECHTIVGVCFSAFGFAFGIVVFETAIDMDQATFPVAQEFFDVFSNLIERDAFVKIGFILL